MKQLFLFLVFIFSSSSFACSCIKASIEDAFKNADYVYIGQIESAKRTGLTEVTNYLSITKGFKGARETDVLISEISEGTCASIAAVGYTYVVFGKNDALPKLHACSQTQMLFGGKQELVDKLSSLATNK
ncbi:hypothetical protein [Aliiglaciecola litoralis]|uniref:Lipoprotein n=1 Tax=Aliiglaciecola litoralis TaxID=582857 RepID=A0ABN1LUU1_9ALTE